MGAFIKNITYLHIISCIFIDLPDSLEECSIYNESECISCPAWGKFITGEGMNDYSGVGHIICLTLWVITCVIGTFGTFTNILIIAILERKKSGRPFDTLLIALACFDLVCSVSAVITVTSAAAYFQNWNRGILTLNFVNFGTLSALFAKSGSSFMTVLITIERFLIVAIPSRAPNWFTARKCKLFSVGVLLFSFLMSLPRTLSVCISTNHVGRNIKSTGDLSYIVLAPVFKDFWYVTLAVGFNATDYFLPLILLVVFNVLLYFQIRKFTQNRKNLNVKQRNDISAAKMFVPVVTVLFLCNIEPIVHYYYFYSGVLYREHAFGVSFSMAVNSAANLPIYYFKGSSFRKECRALLSPYLPCLANDSKKSEETGEENGQNTKKTSGTRWYNQGRDIGSSVNES